jgi:hypothetical protein
LGEALSDIWGPALTRTIDLAEASRIAAQDPIWAARGRAIQSYSALEQALCRIFAEAGGMSHAAASVIFFRINNARSRGQMLEKLIRLKHGATYNVFVTSLLKNLSSIDQKRNEIVHWQSVNNVALDADGKTVAVVTLRPPNYWETTDESAPSITVADLSEFDAKCDFYTRLCNVFFFAMTNRLKADPGVEQTWRDVFRQAIAYPPPDTHPLRSRTT